MFKKCTYSNFLKISSYVNLVKIFLNPVKASRLQMSLSLKVKSKPGLIYSNSVEKRYLKLLRFFYKNKPVISLIFRNYCFWNYYSHWKASKKITYKTLFGLNKNLLLFRNRIIKYKLRYKFSNILC